MSRSTCRVDLVLHAEHLDLAADGRELADALREAEARRGQRPRCRLHEAPQRLQRGNEHDQRAEQTERGDRAHHHCRDQQGGEAEDAGDPLGHGVHQASGGGDEAGEQLLQASGGLLGLPLPRRMEERRGELAADRRLRLGHEARRLPAVEHLEPAPQHDEAGGERQRLPDRERDADRTDRRPDPVQPLRHGEGDAGDEHEHCGLGEAEAQRGERQQREGASARPEERLQQGPRRRRLGTSHGGGRYRPALSRWR